tara:strand:- start:2344 stop:2610 length:267 start_codon:yes stop_codon:yes gene_type:complete
MQEEIINPNEIWEGEIATIQINTEDRENRDSIKIDGQKIPDPKLHQRISFIKSAIRLGACAFGFFGMFEIGFIGLFIAEIVGIGEELV